LENLISGVGQISQYFGAAKPFAIANGDQLFEVMFDKSTITDIVAKGCLL
jgi:hypothetical protein